MAVIILEMLPSSFSHFSLETVKEVELKLQNTHLSVSSAWFYSMTDIQSKKLSCVNQAVNMCIPLYNSFFHTGLDGGHIALGVNLRQTQEELQILLFLH